MYAAELFLRTLILWICHYKTALGADKGSGRPEYPVTMPDITTSDLDFAGQEGRSIVQRTDQLETELQRRACGQSVEDGTSEILPTSGAGKTNSTQGAWPWMAAIRRRDETNNFKPWCSGFLIDKRHVLSVAQCFDDKNNYVYRVGIGHINQNEAVEYRITRIAIPPGYRKNFYYDNIAILTLDREVNFPNFNPVCLPDEKIRKMILINRDATAAGWGADEPNGEISTYLKHVSGVTIVRNQECQRAFRQLLSGSAFRSQFPQGVSKSFLCAGFIEGGRDICAGDSGGPLMIKDGNRWFAVGITSVGYSCGIVGMPDAYTNVSKYLEWIKENTEEVCGRSKSDLPIRCTTYNATEGAWPWMVAITVRNTSSSYDRYCSGFLIDRRHVLSAAQCYTPNISLQYRARIGNINTDEAEEYRITRIAVHEDFTFGIHYDDIAVGTLDREVNFENYSPVCLPDGEVKTMDLAGISATLVGWNNEKSDTYLKQSDCIPIIDNQRCQRIYTEALPKVFSHQLSIGISKGFVCAGYMDGMQDVSEILSGSPLMIKNKNQWYAVGILLFGQVSYRPSLVPDGYIRVSNYLDWIYEQINE